MTQPSDSSLVRVKRLYGYAPAAEALLRRDEEVWERQWLNDLSECTESGLMCQFVTKYLDKDAVDYRLKVKSGAARTRGKEQVFSDRVLDVIEALNDEAKVKGILELLKFKNIEDGCAPIRSKVGKLICDLKMEEFKELSDAVNPNMGGRGPTHAEAILHLFEDLTGQRLVTKQKLKKEWGDRMDSQGREFQVVGIDQEFSKACKLLGLDGLASK